MQIYQQNDVSEDSFRGVTTEDDELILLLN